MLYRFAPNKPTPVWRVILPGALLFAGGWLGATAAFAFYAANFGSYNATYGSLGAVIVLMTWLFLSAFLLLFGAHFAAAGAQEAFKSVFQKGENPEEMESFQLRQGLTLLDIMMEASVAPSKSQARRLIDQNAVRLDGETLDDPYQEIILSEPAVLQVGKRRFRQLLPPK